MTTPLESQSHGTSGTTSGRRSGLMRRSWFVLALVLTVGALAGCGDPTLAVMVENGSDQELTVTIESVDIGRRQLAVDSGLSGLALLIPDVDRAPISATVQGSSCQVLWAGRIPDGGGWLRIDPSLTVNDSSDGFPTSPPDLAETDRC